MAGTRRKRSPDKNDPSKRRRTGERANPTNETNPQEPATTDPEQTQDMGLREPESDNPIRSFMAKWEQMAPRRTRAASVSEDHGDHEDSRPPGKSVRFATGTERAPEDARNRDQDSVNDQLARENGYDVVSELPAVPLPRTRLLQEDFKPHPVLPRTDDEFEEILILIKRTAWQWAFEHFSDVQINEARKLNLYKLAHESPELMEYANWIALGGNRWEDIFNDKRSSLIFGILGKMLEVHIFGNEMFGATPGQLEALLATEKEMVHVDGFARQQVRAATIRGLMGASVVPPNFDTDAQSITVSFYTMIRPLIPEPPTIASAPTSPLLRAVPFSSDPSANLKNPISRLAARPAASRSISFNTTNPETSVPAEHTELIASLYQIISAAAKVSLNMRREPATIYHISSPAKNSPFALETSPVSSFTATSEEMHCINLRHLRRAYAYVDDTASALVTMVCFPGIVAYRPGNGREGGEDDGYRTRRICTAEVVVGWASRAAPVKRARGAQPVQPGTGMRNWTWGPGDWDISLREAAESRQKSRGLMTPLLVAGGMAGAAGIAAVAGYMQAQAMNYF